jgi:hypothetical protein
VASTDKPLALIDLNYGERLSSCPQDCITVDVVCISSVVRTNKTCDDEKLWRSLNRRILKLLYATEKYAIYNGHYNVPDCTCAPWNPTQHCPWYTGGSSPFWTGAGSRKRLGPLPGRCGRQDLVCSRQHNACLSNTFFLTEPSYEEGMISTCWVTLVLFVLIDTANRPALVRSYSERNYPRQIEAKCNDWCDDREKNEDGRGEYRVFLRKPERFTCWVAAGRTARAGAENSIHLQTACNKSQAYTKL